MNIRDEKTYNEIEELMEMQPLPECLSLPVSVCLSTLL